MFQVIVGATASHAALRGRLERELRALSEAGMPAMLREECLGGTTFFHCSLCPSVETPPGPGAQTTWRAPIEESFKAAIAAAVAATIVEDVEPQLLRRRLKRARPKYSREELDDVVARAAAELDRLAALERSERARIAERLLEYLWEERLVHVEGFVRFRLQEYVRQAASCLEIAVKRFEAEREHVEFVKTLRYFMECQEPVVEELHILPDGYDSFRLEDPGGTVVHDGYLEEFVSDLSADGTVSREDLLVSALITLAPQHVRCHLHPGAWNLVTLERVLAGRMEYCTGCTRCRKFRHS